MELICSPSRCRSDAISAINSGPISLSFRLPSVPEFFTELMPKQYQSQVLGAAFSKVDFAHGSTRCVQKLRIVRIDYYSRRPTSPLARDARCVASICRAVFWLV